MNPLASRLAPKNNWIVPVSVTCGLLGFMMAMAWVTQQSRPTRLGLLGATQQQRISEGSIDQQEESARLRQQITTLTATNTKLENTLANQTGSTKVLNEGLQDAKVFAGLTDVEGPGIVVTLRDSAKPVTSFVQDQIIHDGDVLRVTNELWNAGAEAIAINGHRVVSTTSCRCVGSTILVNNSPIASPVQIRAIGDAKTMTGALNLPAGVLSELRNIDPAMAQINEVKAMTLTSFDGSTRHEFLTVPKPSK